MDSRKFLNDFSLDSDYVTTLTKLEDLKPKIAELQKFDATTAEKYKWVDQVEGFLIKIIEDNEKYVNKTFNWIIQQDEDERWTISSSNTTDQPVIDTNYKMYKASMFLAIRMENKTENNNLIIKQKNFVEEANKNHYFFSNASIIAINKSIDKYLGLVYQELCAKLSAKRKEEKNVN